MSRAWVNVHKSNDPDFAARCDAAIAACANAMRGDTRTVEPPRGWRTRDGVTLVIRGGTGRRAVIARAHANQWTIATERRFLSVMARTANARMACAAAGVSLASAYARRSKWPGFAAGWAKAAAVGHDMLTWDLLAQASAALDPEIADDVPGISFSEGLRLADMLERRRMREAGLRPVVLRGL